MISACLLGIRCRYDGGHSRSENLVNLAKDSRISAFCPEQMGGLPTPRPPANIEGGDGRDVLDNRAIVKNDKGDNVTHQFIKGAKEALKLARLTGSYIALTKDKSPSCGLSTPYCDKEEGRGIGVTAALFEREGIKIIELGKDDPFPSPDFLELIRRAT
jgi:uncharacterized protein YbbK (DUF523 family)